MRYFPCLAVMVLLMFSDLLRPSVISWSLEVKHIEGSHKNPVILMIKSRSNETEQASFLLLFPFLELKNHDYLVIS